MVGRLMGHPVRIVMPDNTTPSGSSCCGARRGDRVLARGRRLERRHPDGGANGRGRFSGLHAVPVRERSKPARPRGGTGPEILDAVPDVDVFVAGLGTGGTLTGVGRSLKRARPGVRVVAAEPLPGEQVQGLRSLEEGYVPPVLDQSVLDDRYLVSNREAAVGVRRLMSKEGIFAGLSSGAALSVALRVAADMDAGSIVVLLADGGWKYLSTGLWDRDLDELEADMEAPSCGERRGG